MKNKIPYQYFFFAFVKTWTKDRVKFDYCSWKEVNAQKLTSLLKKARNTHSGRIEEKCAKIKRNEYVEGKSGDGKETFGNY